MIVGAQGGRDVAALIERERQRLGLRPLPVVNAAIVPLIAGELRDRKFLAFCGIGRPGKFYDTLREAGISAVKSRSFPDHHLYTDADALSLIAEAKALNAGLITTEKDHVRLKGQGRALEELYRSTAALPISIQFSEDGEAQLLHAILSRLRPSPVALE